MEIKPKVGDVFLIPLDELNAVGGQVISIREEEELYLAVFGHKLRLDESDPEAAISGAPVLLALSFDAKFWHGSWPIIGNRSRLIEQYPQPSYKVKHAGIMSIESRDKQVLRAASPDELEILRYRSVASPAIIEEAIKAHFGIGEWDDENDELLAEYAIVSSKLL
jgi:Immunity protein 26